MATDQIAWTRSRRFLCRVRICCDGIFILALCAFVGCRVGPDKGPPSAPLSNQWKQPEEIDPLSNADICGPWWSEFQDPALDGLIQQALVANPGLHEACFRVLEARARCGIVTGNLFPEVKGKGSYAFKKISDNSSPYAIVSQDGYNLFSTGFDAAWELDIWGKYRRAVEAAGAEIGMAENDYHFVILTLLGDVAGAYIEMRMYQERIVVARQNLKIQKHTLRLAQERHRAGLAKPLDAAQATSSLYATKSIIPQLEIGRQKAENRLCVLLGETPRDLRARLGTTQPIPVAPQELSLGLPADLLRRRPDVHSAELKVAAESSRIGIAIADLYPQLSLTGTITVDSTEIVNLFTAQSIAHKVGPSLTWNILNFGRIRNRIKAQEARFEQAVWHYQSTVLSAVEEVENALVASKRERVRAELLTRAVAASKESVRLAELYYGQGLANFQSVLDSQSSLLILQDQLTISHAKMTLSRVALYKALGGGWEAASFAVQADHDIPPPIKPEIIKPEIIKTPDAQQPVPTTMVERGAVVRRLPPTEASVR